MPVYIYQRSNWPNFTWNRSGLDLLLVDLHMRRGRLLGRMEQLGFSWQEKSGFENLATEVIKSGEIEGELLNDDQVRSSIARKLGIEIAGMVPADRHVDGIVEMMVDATRRYREPLNTVRLFGWHAAMFPGGYSGMHKTVTGSWRNNERDDPMQVVSGPLNRQTVHFQAPDSEVLPMEMDRFVQWFNDNTITDPLVKAGIAHLWFVTIHPFDDGNGRIARAITDMQLARADETYHLFYSMSAQIRNERKSYYDVLEQTQKGDLDITDWLRWFFSCLGRALEITESKLDSTIAKARFWEHHSTTILNARQVLMLNKLLDGFEGKLNSSKWAKITKTSADTALRDINDLVSKNILAKESAGGRSTGYSIQLNL